MQFNHRLLLGIYMLNGSLAFFFLSLTIDIRVPYFFDKKKIGDVNNTAKHLDTYHTWWCFLVFPKSVFSKHRNSGGGG